MNLQAQKKPRAGRADAGQRRAWAGGQISAPSQRNTLGAALFPSSGFFLKIFLGLRIRSRPSPILALIALAVVGRRASATFRFFGMAGQVLTETDTFWPWRSNTKGHSV